MLYLIYLSALPAGDGNNEHEDLIRRAQENDRIAFEKLSSIIAPKLKGFLLYETPKFLEVEEIMVITMERLFFSIKSFRFESSILTYTFKIARRVKYEMLRKLPANKGISTFTEMKANDDDDPADRIEYGVNAEDIVIKNSLRRAINKALSELSPDHREIIICCLIHELSTKDTAILLGIKKEGTIKSRLARAKEELKKKLENFLK